MQKFTFRPPVSHCSISLGNQIFYSNLPSLEETLQLVIQVFLKYLREIEMDFRKKQSTTGSNKKRKFQAHFRNISQRTAKGSGPNALLKSIGLTCLFSAKWSNCGKRRYHIEVEDLAWHSYEATAKQVCFKYFEFFLMLKF